MEIIATRRPQATSQIPIMSSDFTVQIGTSLNDKLSLRNEIAMVKVAALFADRVIISSATLSLLRAWNREASDPRLIMEVGRRVGLFPSPSMNHELATDTRAVEVARLYGIQRQIDETEKQVSQFQHDTIKYAHSLFEKAGGYELIAAEQAGVLVVDDLGIRAEQYPLADLTAAAAGAPFPEDFFWSVYQRLLSTSAYARYPFLDRDVTESLRDLFETEGVIPSANMSKRLRLPMFTDVVLRTLPVEALSMEEVLDVRREVMTAALAFRSSMSRFAEAVKAEPWSAEFASEAKYEYDVSVRPRIKELEEALKSTSLINRLRTAAGQELRKRRFSGLLATLGTVLTEMNPWLLALVASAGVVDRTRSLTREHREHAHSGLALYCQAELAMDRILQTS